MGGNGGAFGKDGGGGNPGSILVSLGGFFTGITGFSLSTGTGVDNISVFLRIHKMKKKTEGDETYEKNIISNISPAMINQ